MRVTVSPRRVVRGSSSGVAGAPRGRGRGVGGVTVQRLHTGGGWASGFWGRDETDPEGGERATRTLLRLRGPWKHPPRRAAGFRC